ncbi:helix-turn-helix domain containing protein [Actinomycetospora lutea]|uniref:TetR/AcrR family transcriptional regulator n=1 Tax=Actinomycetospora lutea TaxID=663604 RepID=UPI002366FB5F|nr:TetR/AcrR family transcriptional regulator [Actinomycetospora lutea]MDD7940289.1 helix-turn-helix domain containing protein [Actinomycetospora lutea]
MAIARTPRPRWIDAGLQALASGGPDAVQVESLARSLGVSKGGFYGYFADRPALLEEVLATWEARSTEDVIARVEQEGGDAMARALRAAELTFSPALRPIDLAVRDWARRDAAVAERLRRVDNARIAYLRELLEPVSTDADDLEARCFLAFSVAVADPLIAAEHGTRTRADVLAAVQRRLFARADAGP